MTSTQPAGKAAKKKKKAVKPGLYANIHAKQERIAHGSGEKMREPGSPGAPDDEAFAKAEASKAGASKGAARKGTVSKSTAPESAAKTPDGAKTAGKPSATKPAAAKRAKAGS